MNNLRMNMSMILISLAIKSLPKEWQTKKAITNLISADVIKIVEKPL